jgi:hypothetical protein
VKPCYCKHHVRRRMLAAGIPREEVRFCMAEASRARAAQRWARRAARARARAAA